MTVTPYQSGGGVAPRSHSSSLYDVLELILDKGLVIDAYIRVSLVGIELLTIDIRIVIASVDTYLRFAEAVNRVDLTQSRESRTLPELVGDLQEQGAGRKVKGALSGAGQTFSDAFQRGLAGEGRGSEEEPDRDERMPRPRGRSR